MVREVELDIDRIKQALQAYADRGVFRSYSEKAVVKGAARSKHEFRFAWLIDTPFLLVYNPSSHTFTFKGVFPEVEKSSFIDSKFRDFLRGRYREDLPEHRRVNKSHLKLSCINQENTLSIRLKILPNCDYEYAVNKAVNLLNDIFHGFLCLPECEVYRRKTFGIPGE